MSCSPAEHQQQHDKSQPYEFVCDIGNPLPAGATAAFGFKMRGTADIDMSKEYVEVKMGVNRLVILDGKEVSNYFVQHK